jgi:uncharacterized protein YajQ (UPF0234 family)
MFKKFQDLWNKREDLPEESKAQIESLHLESIAIENLEEMKKTLGWKMLQQKIEESLMDRIKEKIKDDEKIRVLLEILSTVETKNATKNLEEIIKQVIE